MRKQMRKEAVRRLENLVAKYRLNPNLVKYFKQNELYYSYLTCGGIMGSIDKISYDPKYEKAVSDIENKYNLLIYHAVESMTPYGLMLSLLYVSSHEDQWEEEEEQNDIIPSYTINFTHPQHSEFGEIVLLKHGIDGALVRLF